MFDQTFGPSANIDLSENVITEYSDAELQELIQKVADEYGLDKKDIETDINYEVSGTFIVENADPAKAAIVEDTIKNSISQQTGVPVSDIDVDYNIDTGEVSYTVQTESYTESNGIKENIDNDSFTNEIKTSLSDIDNNIDISSPTVGESIVAGINIVVDGKDTVDINEAINNLTTKFSSDGFDVEKAEGRNHSKNT